MTKSNLLSPDGLCKSFDESADGYVRSEACGVLVLKDYDTAIADGDTILAILDGSAINHNGDPRSSIAIPSSKAQERLINTAFARAGISPTELSHAETHGTGTGPGDSNEQMAISNTQEERPLSNVLILGSGKTVVGHSEPAAAVIGLTKLVLSIMNNTIPRHTHLTQSVITDSRLALPGTNLPWKPNTHCRRIASLSSFGFTGVNGLVIVSEPPPQSSRYLLLSLLLI